MTPTSAYTRLFKRVFDTALSFWGLFILALPMVFIALAVKMTSRGPALFSQFRVGTNRKLFLVYKFRTMKIRSSTRSSITVAGDERVTSFGCFLRKWKLDEWPQLWNVCMGDMSMVGPRPDVLGYADRLKGSAGEILVLKPGVTGPAALYFRNEEELLAQKEDPKRYNDQVVYPAKMALNLYYLERLSFSRDIGYILITVFPFLSRCFHLIPTADINTLARLGREASRENKKKGDSGKKA
jgi:lipopolysaccharide/colanic/teichoic acid biosynthesis glycosyltransferase